jgi:dihydroorotate dehydrogenase electron transfer subunit
MTVAYADQARAFQTTVVENQRVAKGLVAIRFAAPEIARRALPGQFVMIRIAGRTDPLIGRALAIYRITDRDGHPHFIELVYQVKGRMTTALEQLQSGDAIEVWGPLGNRFSCSPTEHLVLVAGGIGQTPFLSVAQEALGIRSFGEPAQPTGYAQQVHLLYGARNVEYFAGLDDFRSTGLNLLLSTDDGSSGKAQRVTELLQSHLQTLDDGAIRIACCGPEPMMAAVSEIAKQWNLPCEVSLETPMACGIGICFTCVAKVQQSDGTWDYKRTCVEGPIFSSEEIVW